MTFYDSQGKAIAYAENDGSIYLFNGKAVAYLHGDLVYAYNGRQLGRLDNGWIRDKWGRCAFYSGGAIGGPLKPMRQLKPMKSLKQLKPLKCLRELPTLKAATCMAWSELSGEQFFEQ